MGPFPKSYKFEYILVAIDYVSKWAEAQALPTNDSRVVITFLKKLFCRFGIPKALISGRGTHFYNKIIERTMKRYGVNYHFSTSYHPQTSGQVENTNIALKGILEKTVKDNPAIWSRKLDDALWAFCTAYKTLIGTTPYKLIYGKNCHSPFEIEHRAYWALKNCNSDLITASEKRMFQLHELDELRHQAYENSHLYKARTKVWHNRKLRMRKEFKHENKVMLYHSKYKFKQPKLRSRWLGPYVVKHQYPSGYVELYGKDGNTFIVNGHRLKLYHEEDNDPMEAVTPFSQKNDYRRNLKKRNDDFNGNDGENAYEHINKFLEIIGSIKINGLTQDRFRLSIFPVALAGATYEWFTKECIGSITTWDNMLEKFILKFHHLSDHNEKETEEDDNPNEMDNVPEIFRIEGNLFDFETPLCEAYHEFSRLLKIDIDLFTYDIQNIKTYDEYKQELNDDEVKGTEKSWSENGVPYQLCDHICEPYRFKNGGTKWPTCTSDIDGFYNGGKLSGMVRVGSMTYFQDHKWYDELADGTLKDETLALKAKIEGSWGDATLGVVKFCKWLKRCFENFHELEYEVLVKLQECWWKVNAHEIASFTRMENFRRGLVF
ncbi:reverse transcriptase domain-containing protein [Tanacetum coccineum]